MTRDYEKAQAIDEALEEDDADIVEYAFDMFVSNLADRDLKRDVGPVEKTFMALDEIDKLRERVEELEGENASLRGKVQALGDIGEEKTTKEQKIAAIVTYADRLAEDDSDAVTVLPKTIKGVADVSRRYAYDLVDDMVEDFDWALDPADQPRHLEQDAPQKGVLIDFERLHEDPSAVNKFTTAPTAVGVAD